MREDDFRDQIEEINGKLKIYCESRVINLLRTQT